MNLVYIYTIKAKIFYVHILKSIYVYIKAICILLYEYIYAYTYAHIYLIA